jgi:hypothetical protein
MANTLKISSSNMNVGGVLTEVMLKEWAQLSLNKADFEKFQYDLSSYDKLVEVGVADGSIKQVPGAYINDIIVSTLEFNGEIKQRVTPFFNS